VGRRIRRYTQLPGLIHMLSASELTLLDPASWDDRNDSYFLRQYKEKRGLASVLALCFTTAAETYHHWRVFAPESAGVRVSFDLDRLQPSLDKVDGLRLQRVTYMKIMDAHRSTLAVEQLPFLKRHPYAPEREFRLLWESPTTARSALPVPFDLTAITDITLSPWLPEPLETRVKSVLKSIPGCNKMRIARSTLVGNDTWMRCADRAT